MRIYLFIGLIVAMGFTSCMESEATTSSDAAQSEIITANESEQEVLDRPSNNQETAKTEQETEVLKDQPVAPSNNTIDEPVSKPVAEHTPTTATKSVQGGRAKMVFASKVYDYGMIAQGDKVKHAFTFTNTGTKDLIIASAEATCGCTQPGYPFMPIAPGETGTISVVFNSTGKMGPQKPAITVVSNAYPRVQKLYLDGFVTDKIEDDKHLVEELDINTKDVSTKGGGIKKDTIKKEK